MSKMLDHFKRFDESGVWEQGEYFLRINESDVESESPAKVDKYRC